MLTARPAGQPWVAASPTARYWYEDSGGWRGSGSSATDYVFAPGDETNPIRPVMPYQPVLGNPTGAGIAPPRVPIAGVLAVVGGLVVLEHLRRRVKL